MPSIARTVSAALCCLALSPCAFGSLGDQVATVAADQARMMAARATRANPGYSVEELTLSGGTIVREYVSPSGTVFGISWRGPTMPNLQQLLGSHIGEADSGVRAYRASHGGLGPVSVASGALVLYSGGHMRHYKGRAYLPAAIPSNLTADVIQ
jgi:hypothetical protein